MNKIHGYLGLAARAGQVVSGEQAVVGGIRRKNVLLLLIAEDASENTHRKFSSLAQNHNVRCSVYGSKNHLGHAIGKSPRAVVGISDRNFANVIQAKIRESVQKIN